jgi:hypothetical protein
MAEDGRIFPALGEGSDTRVKVTIGPREYFKDYPDYGPRLSGGGVPTWTRKMAERLTCS